MSRITYTKKGSNNRTDTTLPIRYAPARLQFLWFIGNLLGFNLIKRNAVKSRGYSIDRDGNTYTAVNFGKWVAYYQKQETLRPIWFKRTFVDGEYQMTPVNKTNTSMQAIRVPVKRGE